MCWGKFQTTIRKGDFEMFVFTLHGIVQTVSELVSVECNTKDNKSVLLIVKVVS